MPRIKVLLTKIEEVRRLERVKYIARVNLSKKPKQIEKYLQRELKKGNAIDIIDSEVLSVDILDSDMIDEGIEDIKVVINKPHLAKRNKITYV